MKKITLILLLFLGIQSIVIGQYKSKMKKSDVVDLHRIVKTDIDSARFYLGSAYTRSFDFIEHGFRTIGKKTERYENELGLLYELLGDIYFNLEQVDLAKKNYKLAVKHFPYSPIALKYKVVETNIKLLNFLAADKELNSLSVDELSVIEQLIYYKYKGTILANGSKIDEALAYYEQGLSLSKK